MSFTFSHNFHPLAFYSSKLREIAFVLLHMSDHLSNQLAMFILLFNLTHKYIISSSIILNVRDTMYTSVHVSYFCFLSSANQRVNVVLFLSSFSIYTIFSYYIFNTLDIITHSKCPFFFFSTPYIFYISLLSFL